MDLYLLLVTLFVLNVSLLKKMGVKQNKNAMQASKRILTCYNQIRKCFSSMYTNTGLVRQDNTLNCLACNGKIHFTSGESTLCLTFN